MQTVTSTTLREDEELRKFFETLVSTYLNSHSQYARIDILNCPGSHVYPPTVIINLVSDSKSALCAKASQKLIMILVTVTVSDVMSCTSAVSQNSEGEKLIADMKKLLGVPVFAYSDIQGAQITEAGSDEKAR